jgi:hypothetical protein
LGDFTRIWGFYLEGVWQVAPSEEASRHQASRRHLERSRLG